MDSLEGQSDTMLAFVRAVRRAGEADARYDFKGIEAEIGKATEAFRQLLREDMISRNLAAFAAACKPEATQ